MEKLNVPRINQKYINQFSLEEQKRFCDKYKVPVKEALYIDWCKNNNIEIKTHCVYGNYLDIRKLRKNRIYCCNDCYDRKSEEVLQKQKETNLRKLGVEWPTQSKIVKSKSDKTMLQKYGHISPAGNKVLRSKINFTRRTTVNSHINYNILDNFPDIDYLSSQEFVDYLNKIGCSEDYFRKFLQRRNISIEGSCSSILELKILKYIKSYDLNYVLHNRNILSNGQEIDIYIPKLNLAIEVNGDYWHSIKEKPELYHYNKSNLCYRQGIRLIHIWEHEWNNNQEFVKYVLDCYFKNKLPEIINLVKLSRDYFQEIDFSDYKLHKPILEIQGRNHQIFKSGFLIKLEIEQVTR